MLQSATIISLDGEILHLTVAHRLRAMIVEGELAAGEKLNERELAERLRVSRTPLREALKLLTAEGLVEHLPNRGATVVQLSAADVTHAFEVMAALEGLSGELACARITDAEVDELKALNYEMRAHHARRELPAYYRVNAAIHRGINRAARNPVLAQTYDRLNARLQALRFRSNFDTDKWNAAVREHDAMIEALVARDGPRLRQIMNEHMKHKRDIVLTQLQETSSPPAWQRESATGLRPAQRRVDGNTAATQSLASDHPRRANENNSDPVPRSRPLRRAKGSR